MSKLWDKLIKRASLKALDNLAEDNNYEFARDNQLFLDLSSEAFLFVMNSLMERHYNQGEFIFREGNPGICLFIVKSGRIEIFAESDEGHEKTIYSIEKEGSLFGEISIVTTAYRTSSARALDHDTTVLTISRYDLDQIFDRFPKDGIKMIRSLTNTITDHLFHTNQKLKEANTSIKQLKEKLSEYE